MRPKSARAVDREALRALNAYFTSRPPAVRMRLVQMRRAIRAVAPAASETLSYGIPSAKIDGRALVYYAAWKSHVSLYPMTGAIRRAHAAALRGYRTAKGTIQFPHERPLPVGLIRRLVRARLREMKASGSRTTTRPKPARARKRAPPRKP